MLTQTILFNNNLFFTCSEVVTLLFNSNNLIQLYSFICIQSNSSKYCYVIPIFLFCIQSNSSKYCYVILIFLFCMQSNSSKYCYVIPIFLFYIQLNGFKYLKLIVLFSHTVKWLQVLLCITNNSIKHQSFVYT